MGVRPHHFQILSGQRLVTITALGDYHKYWLDRDNGVRNEACDGFSRLILDLKKRENRDYARSVKFFSAQLIDLISKYTFRTEVEVLVVPSSTAGRHSPGLLDVAQELVKYFPNFYNGGTSLERTRSIAKKALGAERGLHTHSGTLRYTGKYRSVSTKLLLDDVATSGNSMLACMELLTTSHNFVVLPLVLGRTHNE